MLRSRLEESVWAAVFAKHYDTKSCYARAAEWAKEQNPPVKSKDPRMQKRWEYEEHCVAISASEHADCAVLALRRVVLTNMDNPHTVHILDMSKYMSRFDSMLDADSYKEEFEDVT